MSRIFLIRHAESVANTRGVFQGQTHDTNLSSLGRRQVQALKNRFISQQLDAVYSSPLKRTMQTAQVLGKVTSDHNLIETDHGAWEGLSQAEVALKWPDLYATWRTQPSVVQFPGGEHFFQTATRTTRWLDTISQKPGTYAAVTHSNIIMLLLTKILGLDLNDIWQFAIQPTAVSLIESHSPAKIIYLNDTSHLKGLESDLAKQAI